MRERSGRDRPQKRPADTVIQPMTPQPKKRITSRAGNFIIDLSGALTPATATKG
jgi:hypothetical protein